MTRLSYIMSFNSEGAIRTSIHLSPQLCLAHVSTASSSHLSFVSLLFHLHDPFMILNTYFE